ncbi:MAG: LPS export ABC transporter periplasmic protein LptC [Gammaproteobacteria bacterium]|nr:LPS export ABC transporter periplasmic protein LptC [Gammaproteobacteria bacterium]
MSRLHYFLILLIVAMLAAFGNWLLSSIEQTAQQQARPLRHDPDYYFEDLHARVYYADGRPHYELEATGLKHYPDDDSIDITRPILQMFRPSQPPWLLLADEGQVLNAGTLIHLFGEVDITQPGDAQTEMKLLTRDLHIYADRDYAETDAAVRITQGPNLTTATGMRADLRNGRLELLSNTRGKYEVHRR